MKDPEECEKEIGKAGVGGAYIFSDGRLLETRCVGGGAFIVGSEGTESEEEMSTRDIATVWDGGVAGMAAGLARMRSEKKVIILADSKAAIAAVKKARRTGKAT